MTILSFFILLSISHIYLLALVSIPDVGSSSKIIFESPINAIPTDNLLFCPPDKVEAN
jgi:hypothetical protein